MKCDVCHNETDAYRQLPAGNVCMQCNPFRRCSRCLGIMQTASTPNDMGRLKCDGCGRISHWRAKL